MGIFGNTFLKVYLKAFFLKKNYLKLLKYHKILKFLSINKKHLK